MPLTKNVHELYYLHRLKSKECVGEWILRIHNNKDMNIALDQTEFIDLDMLDWILRRILIRELLGCLKHELLNALNAVEIPELL